MSVQKIKCEICDSDYELATKRYNEAKKKGQKGFCCSSPCWTVWRNRIHKVTKPCEECGNMFTTPKVKREHRFCSASCTGKNNQRFIDVELLRVIGKQRAKEGKLPEKLLASAKASRIYKKCSVCLVSYYGKPSVCGSQECISESRKRGHKRISRKRKELFAKGLLKVTGGTTKWMTYKDNRIQGTYEYRACVILDKLKDLKLIKDWEYTNRRVPYIGVDGKRHTYLLDFSATTNGGATIYIETKGFKRPNDDLKWKAVKDIGARLIIWFNGDLKRIEKKLRLQS